MKKLLAVKKLLALPLLLAGLATGIQAHHSFSAEFDSSKPLKVTGTVTKVEWQNPHIWFYVDVKNPDGTVTNWAFSGGAPGQLMRRGVMRSSIQPGMVVTVEGFAAKDGSNNGNGSRVTFPDGRSVFTSGNEERKQDDEKK